MATSRGARLGRALVVVVLLALAWWALAPVQLGGRTAYVTTAGISMAPRFHTGDLAVLRDSGAYRVGDVAAYRSAVLRTVVLHRIVAIEGGRYTFKGDNNAWLDPEQPERDRLLGSLVLRVPRGGVWLAQAHDPVVLGVVAFLLVSATGTAGYTGHRTRQRRKRTMSRHAAAAARIPARPAPLHLVTVAALVLGVLAIGLSAVAWTAPLQVTRAAPAPRAPRMQFSYTAHVRSSPAYDTTTVTSPEPVFRRVTKRVSVGYAYSGDPGTITVRADLSTPSGWHSTVVLADATAFAGRSFAGRARLDLAALQRRADAAAAATGVPSGPVAVAIRPVVRTARGAFAPVLELTLSPVQLALAGGPSDLVAVGTARPAAPMTTTATLGPADVPVPVARVVSVAALLLALVTAVLGLGLARRASQQDEGAVIRRRYAPLLVPVLPTAALADARIIDVASFATLAKLAERYGLLVLHWAEGGVETFVVQDESGTYRYAAPREAAVWPIGVPGRRAALPVAS